MKLFIPSIGFHLELVKDWKFHLHDEYRNFDWWTKLNGGPKRTNAQNTSKYGGWGVGAAAPTLVTLPKGTRLSVDRIYIRKGAKDFDSVTFRVLKGSPVPVGRFWAKLIDINDELEFIPVL